MPECYIRGNTIKYLRVPDEVYIFLSLFYIFIYVNLFMLSSSALLFFLWGVMMILSQIRYVLQEALAGVLELSHHSDIMWNLNSQ